MDFNKLWKRAELNSIRSFLKYGSEDYCELSDKSYSERAHMAGKNISDFLIQQYPDFDERNEVEVFLNEQICELENVYFEIGLLMGGKLAIDIAEKMKELK